MQFHPQLQIFNGENFECISTTISDARDLMLVFYDACTTVFVLTGINFTQSYLAYSKCDLHQSYFLGYSRSSASHGGVGILILQFLHVVFQLLKVRVYYCP